MSQRPFQQCLYRGLVAIGGDAVQFLSISEQDDDGTDGHVVGLPEVCFRIEIQTQKFSVLVFRLFPEFVQRQDLAFANGSPRRVDVDNHWLFAG